MNVSQYDCTYCGYNIATSRDHVIPHSYDSISQNDRDWSKNKIVPSCKECNNILSNNFIISIAERADYISNILKIKYKKVLSSPDWKEDDIIELGKTLRSFIRKQQNIKRRTIARIAYAESIADMPTIIPSDVWASPARSNDDYDGSQQLKNPV